MTYPEKIPSEKVSSFNFSFSQISSARKSVEKDYENVVERINKIVILSFCLRLVIALQIWLKFKELLATNSLLLMLLKNILTGSLMPLVISPKKLRQI